MSEKFYILLMVVAFFVIFFVVAVVDSKYRASVQIACIEAGQQWVPISWGGPHCRKDNK